MAREPKRYEVLITETAAASLREIGRTRGRAALKQLRAVIEALAVDPEKQTEPLRGPLKGLRSKHTGRFRVIVRVAQRTVRVYVVYAGWHQSGSRADIYAAVERAVKAGMIDPSSLD